jgi:HK97 family phage major capsid protein
LGILNSDCTYSQAKETGQAAATIVTENVIKMRSRMRPEEYQNACWYCSLSCMEQLNLLTIDVGTGGAPIALVNITADGIERILGRPLIYTEFAEAIGTVGDLVLASWPTYLIGEGTYSNTASSIHVRFDYNETAFRFVKQVDGQPWWRTTLTLKNSWVVAPFVTLAARA